MENLGRSRNFIGLDGRNFHLKSGGSDKLVTIPAVVQGRHVEVASPALDVAILNSAPGEHCIWWGDQKFTQGSHKPPVLRWWKKDGIPANAPAHLHKKVLSAEGREVYPYHIKQRVVVALFRPDTGELDLSTIYGLDIGVGSIYQKDDPVRLCYSFGGLCRELRRLQLYFNMMPIRLSFTSSGVPKLYFQPYVDPATKVIQFFSADQLAAIYTVSVSEEVMWYLDPVGTAPEMDIESEEMGPEPEPAPVAAPVAEPTPAAPVEIVTESERFTPPAVDAINNAVDAAIEAGQASLASAKKPKKREPAGAQAKTADDRLMTSLDNLIEAASN
jgi:hypothetical protein